MERIFKIQGAIQHYDWGGSEFIGRLLNRPVDEDLAIAEYWLGIHPKGPACVVDGPSVSQLLEKHEASLPYLMKVLDVEKMLSIQCHPNKEQAELGFLLEEERGVPIQAPERNFKDKNHKPEAMYALSDFWLLHGFAPMDDIRQRIYGRASWKGQIPEMEDIQTLFMYFMAIPQYEVDRLLSLLSETILGAYHEGDMDRSQLDFWAARALNQFCGTGEYDRGIFCMYMMNLAFLRPGQVIYQSANLLHAYLEGQNIEIMSNSDNVLRAGLTSKHVDIKVLGEHLDFHPTNVEVLENASGEYVFPVDDFALSVVQDSSYLSSLSAEILFCAQGCCRLRSEDAEFEVHAGDSFLILPDTDYQILVEKDALVFVGSSRGKRG